MRPVSGGGGLRRTMARSWPLASRTRRSVTLSGGLRTCLRWRRRLTWRTWWKLMREVPKPVCPHASLVDSDPADPKIKCGPMARDAERVDKLMEGAPVGVVVSARDDPSVFFGFCCGTGSPTTDPDRLVQHYSACPIFAADREWSEGMRLFERSETPMDALLAVNGPGAQVAAEP